MLKPGVLLGNRYRLDERIAGGGMGDVWRGTDEVLGRTVAVKILLPALLDEPGFAERFRGEARTMATINHPGVVDVYDYGSDQQIAFLVMEYVEGDALSRTLGRVGRLTPARTMALVAQAADALQAAHDKGIVHRDVKPGNLLVRPNGTLVLTDFGIARSALVGQLTAAGSVLGTASYISPEQAAGEVATACSDVYALGVVAYQCLAGRRPFEGNSAIEIAMKHVRDNPRQLPGDIPPAIRAIVERSMAKDPKARWQTASELAAVSRQAAATIGMTNQPGRPVASLPVPPQRPGPPAAPAVPHGPAPVPPAPRVPPGAARVAPHAPHSPAVPPMSRPPAGTAVGPAGYNRGAAAVPQPVRPRPDAAYSYPRPPAAAPPSPGNRSLLIALFVVLGLLVLICSGVIAFKWRENSNNNSSMPAPKVAITELRSEAGRDAPPGAPYRQVERTVYPDGVTR
ncbi:serine/threonine-protein kinase [Plantactinospora endophytica]|uniref:non-specific serine/threonine protein kinase n=1 Tax=Plantactinospora endophytica TaxID=673535 RepID=A0ABQ4E3A2_9ACTN|nr:serine/threonine-protein kinase [Plantactinospora endophytica]GIG89182.1 putative serine/threonine-protein kinase PknA [Plantactinospora endophytica]